MIAIIQARMTSTRLPGKVLADIAGRPALQQMLERVRQSQRLDGIVVATTHNVTDDPIQELCDRMGISTFRGDEHDVLGRFLSAAEEADADAVVRLTADCPMIDSQVIDQVVTAFDPTRCDYVSNTIERTFPDGLDVEVMTLDALKEANREARDPFLREHVTPYISGKRSDLNAGNFKIMQVTFDADFAHVRWTLDTQEDLERIRELVSKLPENYGWLQALSVATREPGLLGI
jgi:spore coat polysaccharide biosynthesis protein SpsF (cytidylyltransferase family)